MNFPERTINMIKNFYASALCQPIINDIDIQEFVVTYGVPQDCSLSGVLFNIAMIPSLARLNCLPNHTTIKLYQIKVEKFLTDKGIPIYRNILSAYADDVISVVNLDLTKDDPRMVIDEFLDFYRQFNLVYGLKNNDTKIVNGTRYSRDDSRMIDL